jgi:DNA-binding FrmR family transcriptional regulator
MTIFRRAVLKALNGEERCSEILRRLAAARGAINGLMGELMEDHIFMIQIVHTYVG